MPSVRRPFVSLGMRAASIASGWLCVLLAAEASAGNFNSIDEVRPRVGRRGTVVEVTIKGSYKSGYLA